MSATGSYVQPALIFHRKKMKGYSMNNALPGSIGMVSDSGFINTNMFMEYLHHFRDNVQPTKENSELLILDNHSSHFSLAVVNYCRENGIHLLTLPPYSSHKMQPLDRGFFGSLKIRFAYECDKWLSANPGRVIGPTEVAHLVNEAFQKVATVKNATSGFKTSGMWPINKNIFSEEDLTAASMTEIILPSTSSVQNILQNFTAITSATLPAPESLPSTSYASIASERIPSTSYAVSSGVAVSELSTKTISRSSTIPNLVRSSTVTDQVLAAVNTPLAPSPAVDTRSNEFTILIALLKRS
ncbi:uncharacterized protein LOC117178694 [Belonocnema kinseyi]|uniref:uncharacterized protein LOC117178694 n=1 Tax=Belonocnema kinseyi TaxID=2817044 RepID=UPI00143DDA24|nr:uncharacterized protein LOC117178694 [Belonocnema kinseyi]